MDDHADRGPIPLRGGAHWRWLARALVVIGLLLIGAAAGFFLRAADRGPVKAANPAAGAPPPAASPSEVTADTEPTAVALTPEAVARAGIKTAAAQSEPAVRQITVPATVMSNAYRDTHVNALVGGVVSRVRAELGTTVARGEPLAVIFSNELAEAEMKYLSMRAMLEADHQKLERTRQLVEIGAASRQELEEITAIHTGHATEVEAARQRLLLLGLSPAEVNRLTDPSHIVSEVTVPAPVGGVVIARSVNPGQVVGAGQELLVVADLRTVWVIGDLYEQDFGSVRVGSGATVTIPAAPETTLRGRVSYIDPRVDAAARTAKVRVEVQNPNGELRLGMYVTASFETADGGRITLIPRSAAQTVGERAVVYVPDTENEGQFVERPVKLGRTIGERVEVLGGIKPGEQVVTEGSFLLRAEAARARSGS